MSLRKRQTWAESSTVLEARQENLSDIEKELAVFKLAEHWPECCNIGDGLQNEPDVC